MPLNELLDKNEIICTCIPRNNYLLGKREFSILGNSKIVVNTSVGPTFDVAAMKDWLNESPIIIFVTRQEWATCTKN